MIVSPFDSEFLPHPVHQTGLEVAMIAALCSFIDTSNEEDPSRKNSTPSPNLVPADVPGAKTSDKVTPICLDLFLAISDVGLCSPPDLSTSC